MYSEFWLLDDHLSNDSGNEENHVIITVDKGVMVARALTVRLNVSGGSRLLQSLTILDYTHGVASTLKIGQTGNLDSFIQFVCGVVFGWKDSEKGEPMARAGSTDDAGLFDNEANVRGNSDTEGDTQADALDDGGDPWQYENTFPPELCSSPGRDEQLDDVWNYTSRRVTECHNIEQTPLEHRVPSSSTDAYPKVSQIREGEENEKERKVERPYELPSTSSESPANHGSSSQPRCLSPRPTDVTSTNTASPPPSTASQSVTSPHPSQAISDYTTRSSSELSGAQAEDKSCSSTKLGSPTGPGLSEEPAGDTQRGGLAAGTGSTRKRSFFHESYEEDVDEGHKRRKRRISSVDLG
ncbi:hypothetical protein BDP55DRAFT_638680 [Colletotrichum godetiae]|uniref:Uncharacterized protein n=1 Tax=Colletotrichum godetiae TaxID=1209918 RepID=A0AAJ0A6Q8_9PEZI|nr:uncharacterized protein BDP55DRAFT_638680 [Colletotrichum godetiae]KAK1657508.1 hypothetical protein BDP55DRAFT_638680 [Colletotrichum godetiae]